MKSVIYILLNIGFVLQIYGQHQIWQTEVEVVNVQLRMPDAVVLREMEVDLPDDGKVIVKFEGIIWSSKGDVITLAASNFNDWIPDDGNIGVYVYDSLHTMNNFHHTRIYDVEKGSNKFYAVGQNWTDRYGTGIASIQGKLTVEFIPSKDSNLLLNKRFKKYPLLLNEVPTALDSLALFIPSNGKIIVSVDGSASSNTNNELAFTTSLNGEWKEDVENILLYNVDTDNTKIFSYKKVYDLSAGNSNVYLLAKKVQGNMTSSNNAFYGTISVEFVSEEDKSLTMVKGHVDHIMLKSDTIKNFGFINFEAEKTGKLMVQFTGHLISDRNDLVSLNLVKEDTILSATTVQPVHNNDNKTFVSLTSVLATEKGSHTFNLKGGFEAGSLGSGLAGVKGQIFIKFIPDSETTSTELNQITVDEITVFPNPSSGEVFLTSDNSALIADVVIYDMHGKRIKFIPNVSMNGQAIDISALTAGQYFIKFSHDNTARKLVVVSSRN